MVESWAIWDSRGVLAKSSKEQYCWAGKQDERRTHPLAPNVLRGNGLVWKRDAACDLVAVPQTSSVISYAVFVHLPLGSAAIA